MPISIEISPGSDTPIYTQIVDQISQAIAKGSLMPGEKLPPVRKLAEDLVVNPNTVAKAIQLLERWGMVTTKIGSGTFVADLSLHHPDLNSMKGITARVDYLIGKCIHIGLDGPAILKLVEDRLAEFNKPKEGDRHV